MDFKNIILHVLIIVFTLINNNESLKLGNIIKKINNGYKLSLREIMQIATIPRNEIGYGKIWCNVDKEKCGKTKFCKPVNKFIQVGICISYKPIPPWTYTTLPEITLPDTTPDITFPDSTPEITFPDSTPHITLPDTTPDITLPDTTPDRTLPGIPETFPSEIFIV